MTPEPYVSPWCEKTHYLVKTVINNQIVFSFVPNGVQPQDGALLLSRSDANSYINDNGFISLKSND